MNRLVLEILAAPEAAPTELVGLVAQNRVPLG